MDRVKKRTSGFERLLLIVGVFLLIIGYIVINKLFINEGRQLSWNFLQTVFLWLLIVILIILLAISEDIKEGIMLDQIEVLKQIKEELMGVKGLLMKKRR